MPANASSPPSTFLEKLRRAQAAHHSDLILRFSPQIVKMPLPMKRQDDPFYPFARVIINATHDLLCGYMFDLWDYLALGAAGGIALERSIHYASAGPGALTILNGLFGGAGYAPLMDETAFNAHALTLADAAHLAFYRQRPDREAFVLHPPGAAPEEALMKGIALYQPEHALLLVPDAENHIRLRIIGEEALYAGHGEDYAQAARQVLERKLHE